VRLPQVSGAMPGRGSQVEVEDARPSRRTGSRSVGETSVEDSDILLPGRLSQAEAQRLTEFLDASIDMPPSYSGEGLGLADDSSSTRSGSSRTGTEEVLRDVRRAVLQRHGVNPDEDFDTIGLERNPRSTTLPGGVHIVLPDNRVRAVEDQLSRRVRAELLGDDAGSELPAKTTPRTKRPQEGRPTPRRPRNPWYLPPSAWHNPEALKDPAAEPRGGFPYDSQILKNGEAESASFDDQERDANGGGDGQARVLTKREKETLKIVEEYRNYMKAKGHRLPHFLQ